MCQELAQKEKSVKNTNNFKRIVRTVSVHYCKLSDWHANLALARALLETINSSSPIRVRLLACKIH